MRPPCNPERMTSMTLSFPDLASKRWFALFATLCLGCAGHAMAAPQANSCPVTAPANASDKPIRMMFVGDLVFNNSFVNSDIPRSWDKEYFAGVQSLLARSDLNFGNLEGALTERKDSMKTPSADGHVFAFSYPPRYAQLLRDEGFKAVIVANNHAYDFRYEGYLDTLHYLKEAGIQAVGPRDGYATFDLRGLKVAMLGFTYNAKFNSIFELKRDAELVRQAKAQGNFVVVTFHAGAEGPPAIWHNNEDEMFLGENRGNSVAFARAMVDAGADIIVGVGPHVVRAAECYHDKPIIYSLGNFIGIGGLSTKRVSAVSLLLEIAVGQDGKLQQIGLTPLRFDERKLAQVDNKEFATRLVNHLGQHARYQGDFIEFPVRPEAQTEFEAWLKDNAPPPATRNKE